MCITVDTLALMLSAPIRLSCPALFTKQQGYASGTDVTQAGAAVSDWAGMPVAVQLFCSCEEGTCTLIVAKVLLI